MTYIQHYDAPLGRILLAADEVGLTGLWFDGAKYFADGLPAEHTERETPVLSEARRWLDLYFAGREPGFLPPLHPVGSAFRQLVWELLLQVPYGKTTTYGEIACKLAEKQKLPRMSAQAGGGMVSVTVSGKRELVRVTIDPEAVDPDDVEMLQDMVVAAVNEAMRKAEADSAQNMSKLTGGLNLGGLFG